MSVISTCDVTTDWSTIRGSLSTDTTDKKEGTGSLKDSIASPSSGTYHDTIYNPSGSWNWSAKKHILFWFKCDRASTAFVEAVLVIYDTSNKYRLWDLTFSAGEWMAMKKLLSTGDDEGGTPPDLTSINKISVEFTAADTTLFYKKIDYLRMNYQKAVAEAIGAKEKTLRGSREHSGGEDITIMVLSSIWTTMDTVSTVWEESKSLQKDE